MPQRDDHRTGQRREVNHGSRSKLLLSPGDRIAQHQPPFGIGVDHFDGLTRHRRNHITRPLSIAIGHVFNQPADPDHIGLGPALGQCEHSAGDSPCPAHVPLHVFHPARRLDRNPASVESHALANKGGWPFACRSAVPFHHQQARLAHRSLRDAEQRAHAESGHFGLIQHANRNPGSGEAGFGPFDEAFWIDDVGWFGDQFAGELNAIGQRRFDRPGRFGACRGARNLDRGQAALLIIGQLGPIIIITPTAQPRTQQDSGDIGRRQLGSGEIDRNRGFAGGEILGRNCRTRAFKRRAAILAASLPCPGQRDPHRRAIAGHKSFMQLSSLASKAAGLGTIGYNSFKPSGQRFGINDIGDRAGCRQNWTREEFNLHGCSQGKCWPLRQSVAASCPRGLQLGAGGAIGNPCSCLRGPICRLLCCALDR